MNISTILLILAGITISQLTGSGIFEKTKEAKMQWQNKHQLENEILGEYENKIDKESIMNATREFLGSVASSVKLYGIK